MEVTEQSQLRGTDLMWNCTSGKTQSYRGARMLKNEPFPAVFGCGVGCCGLGGEGWVVCVGWWGSVCGVVVWWYGVCGVEVWWYGVVACVVCWCVT